MQASARHATVPAELLVLPKTRPKPMIEASLIGGSDTI